MPIAAATPAIVVINFPTDKSALPDDFSNPLTFFVAFPKALAN